MPATFTRHPVETERKDPGIGGKPPLDRRPTGGGGGDENWDSHNSRRHGPREQLIRYRMAVLSGLAGDFVFFAVLVSAFFVRQSSVHIDATDNVISDWHFLAAPPILWINTALLLLSAFTVEVARRHLFREIDIMEEWLGLGRPAVRRAAPWLIATIILGSLFLIGQWIAWQQLAQQGFFFSSNPCSALRPSSSPSSPCSASSASKCARSPSTAPPGTGTPWASSGSSSSSSSSSSNKLSS